MEIGFFSILFALFCWVCGAWSALKLDAVLTGEPTDFSIVAIFIALISWPGAVIYLATCKHHVNNGSKDRWDY